jgi:hypothetical protein
MKLKLLFQIIFTSIFISLYSSSSLGQTSNENRLPDGLPDIRRNPLQLIPADRFRKNNSDPLKRITNILCKRSSNRLYQHHPKHPDDIYWDDRFSYPGIDGIVYAVAIGPNGDVYVGGEFSRAGLRHVKNIARWNGKAWYDLNGGASSHLGPPVYALAFLDNDLYVGGTLLNVGDHIQANYIARWDGQNWYPLGTETSNGVNDWVCALASEENNEICVGGYFSATCQASVSRIAIWDGNDWLNWEEDMGGGIRNYPAVVFSMASGDKGIYVVGSFTQTGSKSANCIARLSNGNWHTLLDGPGLGVNGSIYSVAVRKNGEVYIGGAFTAAGSIAANYIAMWDGESWSTLGSGMQRRWASDAPVLELKVAENGDLYAGGSFVGAAGIPANNIARWDGKRWYSLGQGSENGMTEDVYTIDLDKMGNVYVGGLFTTAGSVPVNYVTYWDGTIWNAMGNAPNMGTDYNVYVVHADDSNNVYVGGEIKTAGGDTVNGIAKWDGTEWSNLAGGVNLQQYLAAVEDITHDINYLYAGGNFLLADTVETNRIAGWDGRKWFSLGYDSANGVNSIVFSLNINSRGDLYAGGKFRIAGGDTANLIAKWDGTAWSSLGSGIGGNLYGLGTGAVIDVANYEDKIYAGGVFTQAGGKPSYAFAVWHKPPVGITNVTTQNDGYHLYQNSPNPFNSITGIKYYIEHPGVVTITVYDITGQKIRTVTNSYHSIGEYQIPFDAENLPSGIYVYHLSVNGFSKSKKMLHIK